MKLQYYLVSRMSPREHRNKELPTEKFAAVQQAKICVISKKEKE